MIRYVIEICKFIVKLFNTNYYLKSIQVRDISQYNKLKTVGRENYFLESYESYDWNSLRKSLNWGYVPSIIVHLDLNKNTKEFLYHISNGNHRFFILTENKKENDYIKVWVDRRLGRKYNKAIQTAKNMEQKIKKIEKDLKKNYHDRINNSPNKERLKNN